jgi:hypothetical protein
MGNGYRRFGRKKGEGSDRVGLVPRLAIYVRSAILRLKCVPAVEARKGWVSTEVAMDAMQLAFSGPLLYLLIVWGVVTAIFLLLIAWRSVLSSHEDDQIFIDAAQEHMAREQRELIKKIESLGKPLMMSGITSGVLLLLIAGLFVYHGLKNF